VAPEPEGSSPQSQQPANGPCPQPGESTPHAPEPISLRSILIPSSHLRLGLSSGLFPSGFPIRTLCTFQGPVFIFTSVMSCWPSHGRRLRGCHAVRAETELFQRAFSTSTPSLTPTLIIFQTFPLYRIFNQHKKVLIWAPKTVFFMFIRLHKPPCLCISEQYWIRSLWISITTSLAFKNGSGQWKAYSTTPFLPSVFGAKTASTAEFLINWNWSTRKFVMHNWAQHQVLKTSVLIRHSLLENTKLAVESYSQDEQSYAHYYHHCNFIMQNYDCNWCTRNTTYVIYLINSPDLKILNMR
jgi:hypothetical protein